VCRHNYGNRLLLLAAASRKRAEIPDNVGQSSKNLPPALREREIRSATWKRADTRGRFVCGLRLGAPVTLGQYFGKRLWCWCSRITPARCCAARWSRRRSDAEDAFV